MKRVDKFGMFVIINVFKYKIYVIIDCWDDDNYDRDIWLVMYTFLDNSDRQ